MGTGFHYECRHCGKPIVETLPTFPFCSQRCRLLDLGGWLDEGYRISRILSPGEEAAMRQGGGAPPGPLEEADGD
jgi:hypothetical protein